MSHYKDQDSLIFAAVRNAHPDLEVIDLASSGNYAGFIDRICACDAVFSSLIHGLIVAEACRIPCQ